MRTATKSPGKAMYMAPKPDWEWLRNVQRKLYTRSEESTDYVFCQLWGLITDPRNLRMALARVAANRGRRTAGVDGITVKSIAHRAEDFITQIRSELRSGEFRPSPVRRVLIPKIGAPGKFRPLGNPDRERQGRSSSIEEHLGAYLRGRILSRLVWFPAWEIGTWCIGAHSSAPSPQNR